MGRNIGSVVNSINELVAELGLEKLAADDPGTSHPAKQENAAAQIQPASEGARSSENTADVKKEVPGTSIPDSKPGDANKTPGAASTPNITTATFVGENPKVEEGYTHKQTDPGTTSPAKADSNTKESADLRKIAADVLAEIAQATATISNAKEAGEQLVAEVPAEKKAEALNQNISDYLTGYVKSAAIVGELTADYLDGLVNEIAQTEKKAEGEEMLAAPEEGEMIPAEEMGGGEGEPVIDDEALALAEAAEQIAAQLGVEPEDVLEAALADVESGDDAAAAEEMPVEEEMPMEVAAAAKELEAIQQKAAAYDQLMAEKAASESEQKQTELTTKAVKSALETYMAQHQAAK